LSSVFDANLERQAKDGNEMPDGLEYPEQVLFLCFRMLTPRELYNAMGFPVDYIIEKDYKGNVYPKDKQVARCGNAVCPPLAEAMVRANLPEWHTVTIVNMAQFHKAVAM